MARGRGRSGGGGFGHKAVSKWAAGERKRQQARDRQSDRAERKRRSGWVAETFVSGTMLAAGIVASEPAKGVLDKGDAYEQARSSMDRNRDAYLDEQTRAAGDSHGISSMSIDDILGDVLDGGLPDIG
jgi:hypothetical protein